ncbi:rhodanese-like domain-containing protein [Jatrophihabitans endophyticus]|uniref:rhodanese-like domain-containing protein n=1 Tax=Jatrophihabitans endophyticus TaxID=1206085 RepID=UPI0019E027A3|nr:rhodanese-like domain-containing protein [Jatrophihabitans endophyticus]MBE7187334.1 rhodanese-like domain-containing protein [Jatrophihabitans endophyticus]
MHLQDVPTISVAELPPDAVLLDVREDAEWQAGHVDGAVHIPMNEVPQRLSYDAGPVTPDAHVVVTCKVGGRSAAVTAWLRHQGYDAVNLEGGMLAWDAAGRPMVAEGDAEPYVY